MCIGTEFAPSRSGRNYDARVQQQQQHHEYRKMSKKMTHQNTLQFDELNGKKYLYY